MDSYMVCRAAAVSALRFALARDPLRGLRNKGNLQAFVTQIRSNLTEAGYRPEVHVDLMGEASVSIVLKGPDGVGNYTAYITSADLSESLGLADVSRPDVKAHRVDIGVL